MNKPSLKVVRNETDNTAKILLYGIIGDYDYWTDDYSLTAKSFVQSLTSLEAKFNVIDVHIHSPGGSVWEGLAICNAIKASKKTINTYNDGIAMSMGACILACGKNRFAAKGSITMIHNASTFSWGTAETLRQDADMLDTTDEVLAEYFADAMGKTPEEIMTSYFDHKDHFLTAKECETLGLVTITDTQATDVPDNVHNMSMNQVAAIFRGASSTPQNTNENMFNSNKFKNLSALAKVAVADITAEQVKAVNDEIVAQEIPGITVVLDSELETLTANADKAATLATEVTNLKTTHATKVTDLEGQITALNLKLGTPAAAATAPVKVDADATPKGEEVVDDFETSYDREMKKAFGN